METYETFVFPERDLFAIQDCNGCEINGVEFNDDVMTAILSHLPLDDLVFNCRLVCKYWCNLADTSVWQAKLNRSYYKRHFKVRDLPWHMQYWVLKKKSMYKNLIKNPDGSENLKHWDTDRSGGLGWSTGRMSKMTGGPLYEHFFKTSFMACFKEQLVDLAKAGADDYLMDSFQPEITVSEWYSGTRDANSVYILEVKLLDEEGTVLRRFEKRRVSGATCDARWRKVTHTFRNYGMGVRRILFCHGRKNQRSTPEFQHPSKITGSCVQLAFPECSK